MYKIYRQVNDLDGKSVKNPMLILAKEREGPLSKRHPNRYLQGIFLGFGNKKKKNNYPTGYFSKSWGKKIFKEYDGQIEMKSNNKIFTNNGDIYIRGYSKYINPNSSQINSIRRKTIWKLSKDGELNEVSNIDDYKKLEKFKIKNNRIK